MLKMIAYSYPTSPNAKRLGFYSTGCFTVETIANVNAIPKAKAGFDTFEKAKAFADMMPEQYSQLTIKGGRA